MRNSTLAILAALAILLLTVGGVTAHEGNDTASDHERSGADASAAEWTAWMEQHMTEHTGDHMAGHRNDSMMGGMMNGSTAGMGCH